MENLFRHIGLRPGRFRVVKNIGGSIVCPCLARTLVVTLFCLLLFIPVNAANIFVIDRANTPLSSDLG